MFKRKKSVALWLLTLTLLASTGSVVFKRILSPHHPTQALKIWHFEAPQNPDPLFYDAAVHHVAFTSIFSRLATQYSRGRFQGILASHWSVNDDFTKWDFTLRSDVTFSDGSPITPKIILQNFKRVAYLMAKRGSRSDLFDNLKGYVPPKNMADDISGLSLTGHTLSFDLNRPVPNLLEVITFGLYAIIHPSNFDPNTGEFIQREKIISSGRYRLESWNQDVLTYQLRPEFLPDVYPKNNFATVRFSARLEDKKSSDVISGYSTDNALEKSHSFFGPIPSNIMYLHCATWWKAGSPLANLNFRVALREAFYKQLEKHQTPYSRSFFPISMPGVSELAKPTQTAAVLIPDHPTLTIRVRPSVTTAVTALPQILAEGVQALGVNAIVKEHLTPTDFHGVANQTDSSVDLMAIVTGVLVQNPYNDIRFMLHSQEGIRLPDPTGLLKEYTLAEKFDPQVVNKSLYEQAIIWPVMHLTKGIWAKDDVDMSSLNTLLSPIDLGWIGHKN